MTEDLSHLPNSTTIEPTLPTKPSALIFVLWAAQFDPIAASIFVAELRKLGLDVKLVSLSTKRMAGSNGLALYHDLTLSEAFGMIDQISALIVPCRLLGAQHLRNDPRAFRLFQEVNSNQIPIVIGHMDEFTLSTLRLFSKEIVDQLILYPDIRDLIEFTHHLAQIFRHPSQDHL